jgi:hypothetical protein
MFALRAATVRLKFALIYGDKQRVLKYTIFDRPLHTLRSNGKYTAL